MLKSLLCVVTAIGLGSSVYGGKTTNAALAIDRGLDAVAISSSGRTQSPDLAGTVWVVTYKGFTGDTCKLEISFLAGGKLVYNLSDCEDAACEECTEPAGKWKQKGNSFTARVEETDDTGEKFVTDIQGTVQGDKIVFTEKDVGGKGGKPATRTAYRKQ